MQINDLEYDRTSKIQTQKIEKNIDVLIFCKILNRSVEKEKTKY